MIERAVIFTGDANAYSVRRGIGELMARFTSVTWLIVEHRPPRQWSRTARNQVKRLRREGWRFIPDIASTLAEVIGNKIGRSRGIDSRPGREYDLDQLLSHKSVAIRRTPDIHSDDSVAVVREFNADVGICLAAPILKPELFDLPRLGTINLHKGKLPDYRGMPPAFWELWNGEREIGCSIHKVVAGLDAGPILKCAVTPVEPYSTVRGLQIRLDEMGVQLTADAIYELARGTAVLQQQSGNGAVYRKPTSAQRATLRAREPGAKRPRGSPARRK